MWSDGDYIESYTGFNTSIGSLSLNNTVIEQINFINQSTSLSNPDYSDTFFNIQKKLDHSLIERTYLKDYGMTIDVDLEMDADGYISPTTYGQDDEIVKTAAYIHKKNTNN